MIEQKTNLYKLQKKDIPKVNTILADAFQYDPFWIKLFKEESKNKIDKIVGALYESSIKYCYRYGEVYATSENLEGIIAWVPGDLTNMTIWRQIRSGAFITGMKVMILNLRLSQRMKIMMDIKEPVQKARITNMKGRQFIYLQILGVATNHQGKGFGRKLLEALIEKSEKVRIPLYTETTLGKAVGVYERLGFKVINKITLPICDIPMWEFIREPKK